MDGPGQELAGNMITVPISTITIIRTHAQNHTWFRNLQKTLITKIKSDTYSADRLAIFLGM